MKKLEGVAFVMAYFAVCSMMMTLACLQCATGAVLDSLKSVKRKPYPFDDKET